MAAQWYCLIGQQQYGPFTGEQIRQLVQQGQLLREHGVRTETDSHWTAAGELPGLFPPAPSAPEPQAATGQPAIPSVAVKPKKKSLAPAVSLPPAAPAPEAPPAAGPVISAGTALPVAAPVVAAPVARPAQAVPPAAIPVATAPVARAVAPAAKAAAVPAAQPAPGPPAARPVSAARPIPVNPLPAAPPAGAPRSAPPEGGATRRGRGSRKKTQMLVGGLVAAFLLLAVVAVIVITSGPGKKPGAGPARIAAAAKGGGDPEIETGAVAASPESAEIADPVQPLAAEPRAAAPVDKPSALPAVRRWLDATRQKAILRDVVRLGVGHAWLDSTDGQPATLHVEIEITNLSREAPLEFSGWRPDTQPQPDFRAVMEDDSQTVLSAAPARGASRRRSAPRRIAPGQSEREQVSFVIPDRASKKFRLALPYAALGQTGCLGFELPSQMLKDQPPGVKEPSRKSPQSTPETSPPTAEDSERPADDEPETTGPRGEETEASADSRDDAMPDAAEPAADESPRKEQIPDIRKLIEEDRQKRTPEAAPPSGEPAAEAP